MVARFWRLGVIAYFLFYGLELGFVVGSVPAQPSTLDHRDRGLGVELRLATPESIAKHNVLDERRVEDGLGSDLCPECEPLSKATPKASLSSNFDMVKHLGPDMCPECRFSLPAASELPAGLRHQNYGLGGRAGVDDKSVDCDAVNKLGTDMCPECRHPVSAMPTSEGHQHQETVTLVRGHIGETPASDDPLLETVFTPIEDDLGADMCPECRQPLLAEPTIPSSNSDQTSKEDVRYGADMCPECRVPLPARESIPNDSPHTVKADEDQKEMQQQVVSEAKKNSYDSSSPMDFSNAVLELQKLAALQQAQLDQLSGLLQQLDRPHQPGMEAKAAEKNKGEKQKKQKGLSDVEEYQSDTASEVPNTPAKTPPLLDDMSTSLPFDRVSNIVEPQIGDRHRDAAAALPKLPGSFSTQQSQQQGNRGSSSSGNTARGMTVARYRPAWSEHFSFLSAVKVDGEVSCLHLLPQESEEGTSRYVVIGDTTGRLYIFLWLGDLLLDYRTLSSSPITSMLSYTLQKNETILVTGHSDGAVVVHQVWEKEEHGSISDDGRVTLVSIETLLTLVPPVFHSPSPDSSPFTTGSDVGKNAKSVQEGMRENRPPVAGVMGDREGEEKSEDYRKNKNAVTNLEMYKVGKMRYTLVGDASGKIKLFRDNGSLHGVVQSPSRPLAFMRIPSAQRFIFLTDVGVGLLDFRSMQVRKYPCEGLNGSTMTAYSFDVIGRSKAHGFTSDGDLVSVALSGDMLHFECHVKRKRKLHITGPFFPQALKGYLIASTQDRIFVFNTTLPSGLNYASFRVAGPTLLFSSALNEVARSFLSKPGLVKQSRWPLLASNRDRLVVVGFGDGYVGVFRSNLPTTRPADFTAKFWNSSILVSALAILVVWQLIAKKRDAAAGAGTGGHDHTLMAASSDLMAFDKDDTPRLGFEQTRKGTEPREYRSPTRGYVDSKSGTFGSDSRRYRPSSAVDTGMNFSARREPLFASTHPVGELELRQ